MLIKQTTLLLGALVLASLTQCARQSATQTGVRQESGQPRRTEILFLGDNGHHKPIERVPQLMAALGDKGINNTYYGQNRF